MSHKFSLHEGDQVLFMTISGKERRGTLLKRPYGRRLYGIARDDRGKVHYLPSRDNIKERCG